MRVLLARMGALGDLLLVRTAVWRLRRAGHAVSLLAPARSALVLVGAHASQADRLLDADSGTAARLFGGEPPPEWQGALRECGAAVAYSRSEELAQALAGEISDVRRLDPRPIGMHAADWLCQPLAELAAPAGPPPDLPAPSADTDAWLPGDFLAIHAGSGSSAKNWPSARFAELAQALEPAACVWIRGPADGGLGPVPEGALELTGAPLPRLAACLARARLYVGNDSGVSHLAAAVGAPTLALFGPSDPALWAPRGRRVRVVRAPRERLEDLPLETVLAEARAFSGSG